MGLARKLGLLLVALGVAGAAIGWFLSAPVRLDTETLAAMGEGDAARGRRIFFPAAALPATPSRNRWETPGCNCLAGWS